MMRRTDEAPDALGAGTAHGETPAYGRYLPYKQGTIGLPSGRRLGYAEFGDPAGPPVLYFHGWPSSRIEPIVAPVRDVRLIGVDRPGYGWSDPSPSRRLADFPDDIEVLTETLGLSRFAIVGVSGGGPYAAACAHRFGGHVAVLTLIAPIGPPEAPGMNRGRMGTLRFLGRSSVAGRSFAGVARTLLLNTRVERVLLRVREALRPKGRDAEIMTPELGKALINGWREGVRRSSYGMRTDARVYNEPWPFRLEDIAVPTRVLHGQADTIVPCSVGRYYARKIPGAAGFFPEEEGHLSMPVGHFPRILADLKSFF